MPPNNTTTTNGSAGELLTDGQLDIHQGPAWLVDVIYNPPTWIVGALTLSVLASLIIAGVSLYRSNWELDEDVQSEMLENTAIAEGVMLATVCLVWYADQPYFIDVGAGFLVGVSAAYSTLWTVRSSAGQQVIAWVGIDTSSREQFVAGWILAAGLGTLPFLLAGDGAVPLLFRGGLLLTAAGVGLAVYNTSVLVDDTDRGIA